MGEKLRYDSKHPSPSLLSEPELLLFLCHEIRTLLSKVVGYSELMYDSHQTNKERFNCISQIRGSAKEGESVLEEIVELCNADLGTLPSHGTRFHLLHELTQTIERINTDCHKQRLGFRFSIEPTCPQEIISDPLRIKQILLNIATALINTSERGTLSFQIDCMTSKAQNSKSHTRILFRFESTTSNIAPDEVSAAAHPELSSNENLFHLSQSQAKISLRISQRLVQTLSGSLAIQSKSPEPGCQVTLTLDTPAGFSKNEFDAQHTETSGGSAYADLRGCRVLVVEDDLDVQALLTHFLNKSHAEVDRVPDGKAALEKIQQNTYDVILMDLEMPIFDGLQTATEIRRLGINTPIVTLTAHAISSIREKCINAGCDAFLTKPFDPNGLLQVISQYAHRH